MTEENTETPEWMLLLENKKKKPHRLAHEIGAGAPCLSCKDSCPGLDLHFWRKLCRNCKCKKEEHDVQDDEGYEQFEILFSNSNIRKKKRLGAFLNIDVPPTAVSVSRSLESNVSNNDPKLNKKEKGIAFDWIPPDVPEDVAAEYMQQLPSSKLPISGSDGALYRRQQLEKQVPIHDLDVTKCHGLSPDEVLGHQKYLENLKNNVVGQGRVTKLPLYVEQHVHSHPFQHQSLIIAQSSVMGESRPIRMASSKSSQIMKPLTSAALPRPFTIQNNSNSSGLPSIPISEPQPYSNNLGLKTPSAFLPSTQMSVSHSAGPTESNFITEKQPYEMAYSSQIPMHQGMKPQHIKGDVNNKNEKLMKTANIYQTDVTKLPTNSDSLNNETLIPARDGSFISEQEAHDISFSTQIPIGLVSQESHILNKVKEIGNNNTNFSNSLPEMSNFAINNKQNTDPKALSISKYPSDVAFHSLAQENNLQCNAQYSNMLSNLPQPMNEQGKLSGGIYKDSLINKNQYSSDGDIAEHSADLPSNYPLTQNYNPSAKDALFETYASNLPAHVAHSMPIAGDSMPKSAHVIQQNRMVDSEEINCEAVESELASKLQNLPGLSNEFSQSEEYYMDCRKCKKGLLAGEVAVLAERAGEQAAWHPQCFVCCHCEELLVDLIYFYHKGDVYCGRHYADLLDIPRCFACDELIFVKEYTCAEGKAFHVKHFCCYECDTPLGGKQYVPKDEQPVCLDCYQSKYGKSCLTCKLKIAAGDQRVEWKNLCWHVSSNCFRCSQCMKSLLGGRFLVKNEKPFCSKECTQGAL